jgi:hypothetical protein
MGRLFFFPLSSGCQAGGEPGDTSNQVTCDTSPAFSLAACHARHNMRADMLKLVRWFDDNNTRPQTLPSQLPLPLQLRPFPRSLACPDDRPLALAYLWVLKEKEKDRRAAALAACLTRVDAAPRRPPGLHSAR